MGASFRHRYVWLIVALAALLPPLGAAQVGPAFTGFTGRANDALAAADLLGTEVDVKFKVPAQLQTGFYTEFSDRWSMTGDAMWVNMSDFGIARLSVEQDS